MVSQRPVVVDSVLEQLLHVAAKARLNGTAGRLGCHRREVMAVVSRQFRPQVDVLLDGVRAHDPDAVREYDLVVQEAVRAMRGWLPDGWAAVLASVDKLLYRDGSEIVDDPTCPPEARLHVVEVLDRLNEHLRNYERWTDLVKRVIGDRHHVVVHDLAAGHGGFAIAMKQRLGLRVSVTASDVDPGYLALGRERADELGVDVRFVRQDACCLDNLAGDGIDLFTCTQSLHHFTPGQIGRMLGEGAGIAPLGVCFVDGERALSSLALLAPFMALYGRSWPVFHDTVVSIRRMFVEEELRLVASLAPLPTPFPVASGRFSPGYAWIAVRRR